MKSFLLAIIMTSACATPCFGAVEQQKPEEQSRTVAYAKKAVTVSAIVVGIVATVIAVHFLYKKYEVCRAENIVSNADEAVKIIESWSAGSLAVDKLAAVHRKDYPLGLLENYRLMLSEGSSLSENLVWAKEVLSCQKPDSLLLSAIDASVERLKNVAPALREKLVSFNESSLVAAAFQQAQVNEVFKSVNTHLNALSFRLSCLESTFNNLKVVSRSR
jgi:hypothetical protein